MDKDEFLAQLRARLVGRMETEEMEKIITYYKANYDETQHERQRQVLEALGSTEKKTQVHVEAGEKQEGKEKKKDAQKEKAQSKKIEQDKKKERVKGTKAARTAPPPTRPTKPKGRTGTIVLCVLFGSLLVGIIFVGGVILRGMVYTPPQVGMSEPPSSQPVGPTASLIPTQAPDPITVPPSSQPVGPTASLIPTQVPDPIAPPAPTVDIEPVEPSDSAVPFPVAPHGLQEVEEKELDAFTKVSVIVDIQHVVVELGQTYALTMSWYPDGDSLNWKNENGTLKIWSTYSGDGKNRRGGDIRITVPEGEILGGVKLVLGMGDIEVNNLTSDTLTAVTGMGSCQLRRVEIQEIDAKSGMGDIDVEIIGVAQDYGIDLETGLGAVKIDGEKVKDDYETKGGPHELDCATGMGDIKISFVGA